MRLKAIRAFNEFYLKFYKGSQYSYSANVDTKVRIVQLVSKIAEEKGKVSVLDVGGGWGETAKVLLQLLPGSIAHITSTEITSIGLAKQREILSQEIKEDKATVMLLDILYPGNFSQKFDIVICSEVMEHLSDMEKEAAFLTISSLLKQGGYLIYSSPVQEYIAKRFYLRPSGRNLAQNSQTDFGDPRSHIGVPSLNEIVSLFARKGFSGIRYYPLHMLHPNPGRNAIARMLHRILSWASLLLPKFLRAYISPGMVLVGKKASPPDVKRWYNNREYLVKYIAPKGTTYSTLEKQYSRSKKKLSK